MDCRMPQEDDSTGCLPFPLPLPLPLQLPYRSSSSNPTPPPNPPPHQNPIRVSAFSKPSTLPSPRLADHSNRNGSTTIDFTTNPLPPSPPAASAPATTPPPETPAAAAAAVVKYRQCLRNHAASIGGHVLDGCCEFMPCDFDPLRCAACDCHRSFHRKSHQGQAGSQHTIGPSTSSSAYYHHRRDLISVPLLLPPPQPTSAHHAHPSQTNYHHHHHQSQSQKQQFASSATFPPSPSGVIPGGANSAAAAFGGLGGNNSGSWATTESTSEERLDVSTMPSTTATEHLGGRQQRQMMTMMVSKKRFRTKFSPEQKEKMMGFAERVGWRMQRQDGATVEDFCREVGIRRQVLKVWMHNNRHSIKKHQEQPPNFGMS